MILSEKANKGRPLITKFREEARGVGFAVVIIAPDDYGGRVGDEKRPRARQNVVFELGYFIAAIGPARVAALVGDDLERPSDYEGVAYISTGGNWKADLAKELEALEYDVDWRAVAT